MKIRWATLLLAPRLLLILVVLGELLLVAGLVLSLLDVKSRAISELLLNVSDHALLCPIVSIWFDHGIDSSEVFILAHGCLLRTRSSVAVNASIGVWEELFSVLAMASLICGLSVLLNIRLELGVLQDFSLWINVVFVERVLVRGRGLSKLYKLVK